MKHHFVIFFVLAFTVVFAGCSVHTPISKVTVDDLPKAYPDARPDKSESSKSYSDQSSNLSGKWWTIFKDEQLNKLIQKALKENTTIQQARAKLEESMALLTWQKAVQLPSVNLVGDAGRSKSPPSAAGLVAGSYSLSAAASYEIDLWGKKANQTALARFNAASTRENLKSTMITIAAQTADLYYALGEYQHQILLTDEIIKDRKNVLDLVESRYFEGLVPALDVYQARQNLAQARSTRPGYVSLRDQALHAVCVLTNDFPNLESLNALVPVPDLWVVFNHGIPADILKNRPDVTAALYNVMAKDADVGIAVADRFPTIDLAAGFGRAGFDPSTMIYGNIWNIGADLFMPIIDWGAKKAITVRAKASLKAALSEYRQIVLTAFKDVSDAIIKIKTTSQSIVLLKDNEGAAKKTYQVSLERYAAGLSDHQAVLISSIQYNIARRTLLSEKRQLIADRITLARALGGIWPAQLTTSKQSKIVIQRIRDEYQENQ